MRAKFLAAAALLAVLAGCSGSDTGSQNGSGAATGAGAGGSGGGQAGMGGPAGGPGSEEDLIRAVGGQYIYFAYNRSQLTPDARGTLDRLGGWMQANPGAQVQVAGNADERGTEEYNLALGQRRANAARDDLVAKGINAGRLSTISYGKDRPIDPGSTPQAWAKNRNDAFNVGQ